MTANTLAREVAPADILASPTNPRRHFSPEAMAELVASVRSHGVIEPLIVRKNGGAKFHLVAGERRLRAATEAGLKTIPVRVMELSDEEALEVQTIENLHREDLNPVEEAQGFAALIEAGQYTPQTLAEKLGKSRSHIFGRLKLLKAGAAVREALARGELAPSVGTLLAQVPPKLQGQALKATLQGHWGHGGPMSFRQAKDYLAREYSRPLKGEAFFRADPADLTPAGTCAACPRRSGNLEDAEAGSPNVCTDPGCFEAKRKAWGKRRLAEAKAAGQPTMSRKEYEKIRYRSSHEPADAHCWQDSKSRTWRQLARKAKVDLEVILADGGDQGLLELVPKAQAMKAAKAAGVKFSSGARRTDAEKKSDKARKEKLAELTRISDRALGQIGAPLKLDLPRAAWMARALARLVGYETREKLAELYPARIRFQEGEGKGSGQDHDGLEKKVLDFIDGLETVEELMGLVALMLAADEVVDWFDQRFSDSFSEAALAFGIDLKKLAKEVKA